MNFGAKRSHIKHVHIYQLTLHATRTKTQLIPCTYKATYVCSYKVMYIRVYNDTYVHTYFKSLSQ